MRNATDAGDHPRRNVGGGELDGRFERYTTALKLFAGVAGSVGTLVPAASFFTDLAPPFLPLSALIVAAVSAATLIIVFLRVPRSPSPADRSRLLSRSTRRLVAALVLITLYGGLLNFCTVEAGGERFQIGFYKFSFGLTAEGKEVKALHPADTPWQWMMNDGLFTDDGPAKIWEQWSRFASFSLMFVVLLGGCSLWSSGWGTLSAMHAIRQPARQDEAVSPGTAPAGD